MEQIEPAVRLPSTIAKEFSLKAGISNPTAREIITQVLALHQLRIALKISPADLFDSMTESLEEYLPSDDWKAWKDNREIILETLSPDNPISLVQKVARLRYEHQNILYTAKILTDIRPVFDESARELKLMTVGYMLEIEYNDGTDKRQLFAALDALDVANLKAECERAQTKTVTLREGLKPLSLPIFVSGDVEDE